MKVDFYVLENASRLQALRELCLVLETHYDAKQPVYIYVNTANDAEQLDNILWTYREDSFLAHQITTSNDAVNTTPISISTDSPNHDHNHVLVNLTTSVPTFYQQFNHVIEIVFADPTTQQAARERFRLYREHGCQIQTHKLKVNAA